MNVFGAAGLLMVYGIGVVFGALLLFYGMISLITKAFPDKPEEKED